ncbi:HxHSH motif-containing lipoprotein [Metamycoplasma equirhinis]|uniref:HxHSH motif-containing lipoprotein n=1 Tax=Metamycoplasma equirhinis TaxID=92402 RepID=UPI0035948420
MKQKNKLLFSNLLISSAFLTVPIVSSACNINKNEDKENNLDLDEFKENDKKTEHKFKNTPTQQIYKLYKDDLTNLFNKVKTRYRNYRINYVSLKRNVESLRKKLKDLASEQSIAENGSKIREFYEKWINDEINTMKDNWFAIYLLKYCLIFQDVDAVLVDTNLAFENEEFLKHLTTIDKRLSGINIELAETQRSLEALWKFLKAHIYDQNKLTKKEDLDKINIESDKNSHSHSHAIVNLTYEMGLWHEEFIKYNKTLYNDFKTAYEKILPNIVDNINHIEYNNSFKNIQKILEKSGDWTENNNLVEPSFRNESHTLLEKVKKLILEIATLEGIKDQIDLS